MQIATAPAALPRDTAFEREMQKVTVDLLRHKETCFYAGILLMGTSQVIYDNSIPTACTDGTDVWYGYGFFKGLTVQQRRGVVLHEGLHKVLMHHLRDADLRKEDPRLYNAAADYAINAIIFKLPKDFIDLPDGCLFDAKFEGWSARQIYMYLKKECESEQPQDGEPCKDGDPGKVTDRRTGKSYATQPLDQHEFDGKEMTPEEVAAEVEKIGDTLRKGALLAGMRGVTVPRAVEDAQQGEIDWVAALREYVTEACKGRDEWSWKQYDVRRLADDLYAPSSESETVGEIVFAIDTSGSISNADLQKVAGELAHLVTEMPPSKVRVLWWDTAVHGEQCFDEGDYGNIAKMLKPQGGGGTHVGCVSKYLQDRAIQPEAVIVLTDGYVEDNVVWNVSCPTLWVLTSKGSDFEKRAPGGKVITVE
jgi:hypothetical protein